MPFTIPPSKCRPPGRDPPESTVLLSTLRMNPYVRCVRPEVGVPDIKSLKQLLSHVTTDVAHAAGRGIQPAEADTPCLGPHHSPTTPTMASFQCHSRHSSTHPGGGGDHISNSSRLTFTVDSVATPNTFAYQQKVLQQGVKVVGGGGERSPSDLLLHEDDDADCLLLPTSTTDLGQGSHSNTGAGMHIGTTLPHMDLPESVQNERIVSPRSHGRQRPPGMELSSQANLRQEDRCRECSDGNCCMNKTAAMRSSRSAPDVVYSHEQAERRPSEVSGELQGTQGITRAVSAQSLAPRNECFPADEGDAKPKRGQRALKTQLLLKKPVARLEESPYHYIMRNFCGGSFLYYGSSESKRYFLDLCHRILRGVRPILETETLSPAYGLMPSIQAPAFVLGDIHGNFADLSFFLQRLLVFHDFNLTPSNLVFLGDYVDRGEFSLECVMLLFSLKIMNAEKVVLLRGNHEDRVVCGDIQTYGRGSFRAQCQMIFGYQEGNELFLEVTDLFRYLPLAAELIVPRAPNEIEHQPMWRHPGPLLHRGSSEASSGGGGHAAEGDRQCRQAQGLFNNLYVSQATVPILGEVDAKVPPSSRIGPGQSGCIGPAPPFWHKYVASHEERILCTHGGIPRFSSPPRDEGSLEYLRSLRFPRLVSLFPHHSLATGDPDCLPDSYFTKELPRLELMYPDCFEQLTEAGYLPPALDLQGLTDEAFQKAWYVCFDLLWSDPTPVDERETSTDDGSAEQQDPRQHLDQSSSVASSLPRGVKIDEWGFGINTRGSSVVSFSARAVETFLASYGYAMLFRAHQEKQHGLRWSKRNRVLTIFSSSNYLGHGNGAGCVVVGGNGVVQMIEKMGVSS